VGGIREMVEFLNTSKAYAEIESIVSKTKSKLVLISPFIKVPESLLKRLKYVDEKGVRIVVVCRKKDLKDEVRSDLKQLKNLELRFDANLHAKCFYNEESMVITSLNLQESQLNNREMGVLLSLTDDPDVFNEARAEAEFIVNNAEKDRQDESGHCIRCKTDILYNEDEPYCPSCYLVWKKHKNRAYGEKFCHKCGEPAKTSINNPLCYKCRK
jgi:hypothetical protein